MVSTLGSGLRLKNPALVYCTFSSVEILRLTYLFTGLLTVSKSSFLVSITRRQQVAQIYGKPIYVVTEVAITPLASRAEAESSIANTEAALKKGTVDGGREAEESDTDGDEDELSAGVGNDVDDYDHLPDSTGDLRSVSGEHKKTSSVAEEVMARKGGYGRFAQKWFSRKGWTVDQRRNMGMTGSETSIGAPSAMESAPETTLVKDEEVSELNNETAEDLRINGARDVAAGLLSKLLRTTQILF